MEGCAGKPPFNQREVFVAFEQRRTKGKKRKWITPASLMASWPGLT
jgi:hypothetical protein